MRTVGTSGLGGEIHRKGRKVFDLILQHVSTIATACSFSTSYLSISGGFNVGVAFLANDVVDVVQSVGGDARVGSGTV